MSGQQGDSGVEPAAAVAALLDGVPVPDGVILGEHNGYRLLQRRGAAGEAAEPLLAASAGEVGAVYLVDGAPPAWAAELRRRRFRLLEESTLLLRLPGGAMGQFALWASPRYLADRGRRETVWK